MQLSRPFNTVRPYVAALAALALNALLVLTVYFTLLSIQWGTFLSGVLVAAMLAEAIRVSQTEWLLLRRTAQLSASRGKFERETQLRKTAEEAVAAGKAHLRLLDEVLPTMVAFVDHCQAERGRHRLCAGLQHLAAAAPGQTRRRTRKERRKRAHGREAGVGASWRNMAFTRDGTGHACNEDGNTLLTHHRRQS